MSLQSYGKPIQELLTIWLSCGQRRNMQVREDIKLSKLDHNIIAIAHKFCEQIY